MARLLIFLETVFMVWMLYDAARRKADTYWFFIILLPFGEWIYFFAVKLRDYNTKGIKKAVFARATSLVELEREATEVPSLENRLRFAQGLYDAKRYDEAKAIFEEVVEKDDDEKDGIYGLGLCELNLEDPQAAVRSFGKVLELDPAFRDYEPWFDLAFAHWQLEQREAAVDVLKKLVELSPRIKHKAILGKYLQRSDRKDEAREVLEEALEHYKASDPFIRKQAGQWVDEIRTNLKKLK